MNNERGIALIMTVFVIALASVLIVDLGYRMRFDVRASRAFTNGIQAEYVLKSGLNLARVLLEIPKLDGINEDWLGEPWALVAAAPTLPITGFIGEPRLMIVDEDGKIDLNAIVSRRASASGSFTATSTNTNSTASSPTTADEFWKNALLDLFYNLGFVRETYEADLHRTLGNIGYAAGDQVAVIHDWIDRDSVSHSKAGFDGDGFESNSPKHFFYNRPLKGLNELLLVPGMTRERISRIAPYVRVAQSAFGGIKQVNVNTAPMETLLALGFPESQAAEMVQERMNLPIRKEDLTVLTEGDPQLRRFTKVTSSEFSVYCRVVMPNATRWLRASVRTQGRGIKKTRIAAIEFY